MSNQYTKEELIDSDLPRFPTKGLYCEKCKTWIPQFKELDKQTEARIRQLIIGGRGVMAMKEMQTKTGCNQRWAKIWVIHRGKPTPEIPGSPCPYCGGALRTSLAKQCPHCFKRWHSE